MNMYEFVSIASSFVLVIDVCVYGSFDTIFVWKLTILCFPKDIFIVSKENRKLVNWNVSETLFLTLDF